MAAHLAHKIPWNSLCDAMRLSGNENKRKAQLEARRKTIAYVGPLLAGLLREFRRTAEPPSDEELEQLDAQEWGIDYDTSIGGYTGFFDSLMWGYVELNLLLTQPTRMEPLLRDYLGRCSFIMSVVLGDHDGGHPEAIASKLAPAFDDQLHLKPLTAEVVQTLRDHAALLFRCMYLTSGNNKLLDDEFVVMKLDSYFERYDPRKIPAMNR